MAGVYRMETDTHTQRMERFDWISMPNVVNVENNIELYTI